VNKIATDDVKMNKLNQREELAFFFAFIFFLAQGSFSSGEELEDKMR